MTITRAWFCFALVFCAAHFALAAETPKQPSFVIIMADDLGYGDLGTYDGWIKTPHLDRLAAEGMKFTDYHSNGAVCSPTRAALVTGRYQQRAGIPGVINADPNIAVHDTGLQTSELTFANALKPAGYTTGIFGKWHLGYAKKFNPMHHGFDQFIGYISGNIDYISHYDRMETYDWWKGLELIEEEGYSTHLISRHAVEFIAQHKDHPFCLYVAHEAPHSPYQGPNDPPVRGPNKQQNPTSTKDAYRQMVEEVDKGLGQIVAELKRQGLEKQTLVIFCSDNGACSKGDNGPLKGFKGSPWEGGHRVPCVAWWPGQVEAGTVNNSLCASMDIMPTMLALAGIEPPKDRPLDGVDLSPALLENKSLTDRTMFWGIGGSVAMRDGPWKMIATGKRNQLFDMAEDLGETTDLATDQPDRVKKMLDQIQAWTEDIAADATPQPALGEMKKNKPNKKRAR